MAVFVLKGKKKKYSLSRIPYGDLTVGSYKIRPYTSSLLQMLDAQLDIMLNSNPKCVDSQNGDALDNIIECWKQRAKNGLECQRAIHLQRINKLVCNMQANLNNANDWLEIDSNELIRLKIELQELETEADKRKKEMRYW